VVLVFAGVVISVFALSAWYVHVIASAKWGALRERVLKVCSDAKGREQTRPVLRGEPLRGNAWEDYSAALASLPDEIWDFANLDWDQSGITSVETILPKYQAALDHLRTGGRRTEGRFPYVWEDGIHRRTPDGLRPGKLRILALTQAKLFRLKGACGEAALLVLDLLQFTRDCAANGTKLGEDYRSEPGELRELLVSGTLSSEDAKEISRELEILEGAWPRRGDLLMNWNAWLSRKDLEGETEPIEVPLFGGHSGTSMLSLWRYGFSQRIAVADYQEQVQEWFSKVAAMEDRSWSEEREALKELRGEMDRAKNPLVQVTRPYINAEEYYVGSMWRRFLVGQLRALRIAAEYLGTGRILDLEDPSGGRITCELSGGKLRIVRTSVRTPAYLKDAVIEVWR
jgi:hypothetical protein